MAELGDGTIDYVNRLGDQFDAMCQERHEMGAKKYGPVRFLEIDSIQAALEEIADLANYARYTFIKLSMIRDMLDNSLPEDPDKLGDDGFRRNG